MKAHSRRRCKHLGKEEEWKYDYKNSYLRYICPLMRPIPGMPQSWSILHYLSYTFASHAVMAGVPLPVVSRLLGHAQMRMTLRYAHVSDRETEAAAERIGSTISAALTGPPVDANWPVAGT